MCFVKIKYVEQPNSVELETCSALFLSFFAGFTRSLLQQRRNKFIVGS